MSLGQMSFMPVEVWKQIQSHTNGVDINSTILNHTDFSDDVNLVYVVRNKDNMWHLNYEEFTSRGMFSGITVYFDQNTKKCYNHRLEHIDIDDIMSWDCRIIVIDVTKRYNRRYSREHFSRINENMFNTGHVRFLIRHQLDAINRRLSSNISIEDVQYAHSRLVESFVSKHSANLGLVELLVYYFTFARKIVESYYGISYDDVKVLLKHYKVS